MQNFKNVLFNKYYFMQFFMICTLLYTISFVNKLSTILNFLILIWGVLLIFDRFRRGLFVFKKKYLFFLYLFLVLYAISIVLNIHAGLFNNVKLFAVTVLQFLLLFLVDDGSSKEEINHWLYGLNKTFITFTLVTSTVGLIMYFGKIDILIDDTFMGYRQGMLRGLCINSNTGGMVAAASLMLTLINIHLHKKITTVYGVNIAIQCFFVTLSLSRSAKVSLYAFFFLYCIIFLKDYILVNKSKVFKMIIFAVVIYAIFKICVYLRTSFSYGFTLSNHEMISNAINDEEIVNKVAKHGLLNGRLNLWQSGFKVLMHYPLFGVTPSNIAEVALRYTPLKEIPVIQTGGLHNIVMSTLCSTGLLGTSSLVLFCICRVKDFVKYIKINKFLNKTMLLCGSMVLALFINNLVESNILFSASYMAFLMWLYLGYFVYFINTKEKG